MKSGYLKRGLSIFLSAMMIATLPEISTIRVSAEQTGEAISADTESTEAVAEETATETEEVTATETEVVSTEVSSEEETADTEESETQEEVQPQAEDDAADAAGIEILKSPVVNADNSVTFTLNKTLYPNAKKVYLCGTVVNDWDKGIAMTKNASGNFTCTVKNLDPGSYQYKFVVDGTWITDPLNTETESGNSLVKVPGMIISGDNPAGVGSFQFTAQDTLYDDAEVTKWEALDETAGAPAAGMSFDQQGVLTTTEEAADGYFYVQVTYNENGVNGKTSKTKFYYTKQALLYQYTYTPDSAYTGKSDIYTWYNSKQQNIGYKFNLVNGIYQAAVNVDTTTKNFGYIVRLPGMWGADASTDREFTDRTIVLNQGEQYTKVKGGEGIETPYVCPTGKTTLKNGILFTYRDDNRFYRNTLAELDGKVSVKYWRDKEADAKTEVMDYDAKAERFTYAATGIDAGTYHFYFLVNGEKVEDQYMNGQITYEKPELDITATVTPEGGATADENPVVSFDVKDKTTGKAVDVSSITANLAVFGYPDMDVSFLASSKRGVLYIDDSVAAGTYSVPFTVTDAWGNDTQVHVPVTVKDEAEGTTSWDESRIYFLLTDRFVDGDTSNDYDCDKSRIEAYHGGDFAGLTSRLDYIQSLGVNTIWITPIVDNIEDVMNASLHQQAYHGYWAKDFTTLDEHLGNTADFDKLIDAATERGIKIMVDIVVNHAGYHTENNKNFEGMLRTDEDEVKGDVILGDLDNLPDFKTENEDVRAKLVGWQSAWVNHKTAAGNQISYFRVDTVKHVDHETWTELKTTIAKDNPAFKMIGEYFGASISNTGDYLANGQMDALLDFDFKSQARSFVNGSLEKVEASLEARNAKLTNSITMGQFLSSHDEDGFLYSVGNDISKQKVAAALQITAKGTPIVYYGEEINLTGPNDFGNQDNNRYDMQFDNLSAEQQATLTHYQKLLQIRGRYSTVFSKGDRTKAAGSDADAYMVFKRSYKDESLYVGLNNAATAKQATFEVGSNYTTWEDVYSGKTYDVTDGKVTVTIPAAADGGTVILAQKTAMTGITITNPYKTSFSVGDRFDKSGLTVTASYANGEKAAVDSSKYTVSGYNMAKDGTQTVSVTVKNDGSVFTKTFTIRVNKVPATSVSISKSSLTLEKGQGTKLTASMAPSNTTDSLTFSSSNPKVATVAQDGTVKTLAVGTTDIIAKSTSGKTAVCKLTVTISATKISLNKKKVSIVKGKTYTLKATITPANTVNKKVTWTSSKTSVATVDKNGKVTAKKAGTANIIVKTANGKTAVCKVTVTVPATSVKLKVKSKSVNIGKKYTLKATMSKGSTDKLTWSTSNKKVATVDKNGVVKAVKKGTAVITVKTTSGKKATCKITVKVPSTKITLNKKSTSVKKGKTVSLKGKLKPSNSTDTIKWSTSNKKIATVNKNGKVKGIRKGTVTITAKTTSGKKATCKIKVK